MVKWTVSPDFKINSNSKIRGIEILHFSVDLKQAEQKMQYIISQLLLNLKANNKAVY